MVSISSVAIVGGVRTPFGKAGRAYAACHPAELLAATYRGALASAGVEPATVDRILVGCVNQCGEQSYNVGRIAWLAANLTETVPALTLDAQCCSGQEAVNLGAAMIMCGQADIVVAGGVEAASRVSPDSMWLGDSPVPPSLAARTELPHQSQASERMARKYGITRDAADAFGVQSHLRAAQAWKSGAFDAEIVRVNGTDGPLLMRDEGIRADSTPAAAAGLKPAYEADGIVTAANASQLSDGAACVILASGEACTRHGLQPLAWIRSMTSVGAEPQVMFEGPMHATQRLLDRMRLGIDDFDLFEVHEAYAIPVLAWMDAYGVPHEKVNVHGGAISLGHPFGASGARQILHLARQLAVRPGKRGLQLMCGGGGLGVGSIIESALR